MQQQIKNQPETIKRNLPTVKALGITWGLLFILGGILGFVPGITRDGMFLGVFMVNTAHNFLHIASGTIFLLASISGAAAARRWFQMMGGIYVILAAIGFKVGNGMIFNLISNTRVDAWGHALLALILLAIGFATPKLTL